MTTELPGSRSDAKKRENASAQPPRGYRASFLDPAFPMLVVALLFGEMVASEVNFLICSSPVLSKAINTQQDSVLKVILYALLMNYSFIV